MGLISSPSSDSNISYNNESFVLGVSVNSISSCVLIGSIVGTGASPSSKICSTLFVYDSGGSVSWLCGGCSSSVLVSNVFEGSNVASSSD